jgi:quercetin dioxygenase-like cupin family protein
VGLNRGSTDATEPPIGHPDHKATEERKMSNEQTIDRENRGVPAAERSPVLLHVWQVDPDGESTAVTRIGTMLRQVAAEPGFMSARLLESADRNSIAAVVEMQTIEDRRRLEGLPVVHDVLYHLDGTMNVVFRSYHEVPGDSPILPTQQDGVGFRSILPEDIVWEPFPAFPPSARLAVVVGNPTRPGPYTIRVKVPHGVKLLPHRHPEDRVYTVISGVFYIGQGEQFDSEKLEPYPPGAVIVLPGGTPHFHCAESGEYVTQVSAIGPLGLEYLDPRDDPRNG